jgi:hypothetical protein
VDKYRLTVLAVVALLIGGFGAWMWLTGRHRRFVSAMGGPDDESFEELVQQSVEAYEAQVAARLAFFVIAVFGFLLTLWTIDRPELPGESVGVVIGIFGAAVSGVIVFYFTRRRRAGGEGNGRTPRAPSSNEPPQPPPPQRQLQENLTQAHAAGDGNDDAPISSSA